jgi:hypothetical protein
MLGDVKIKELLNVAKEERLLRYYMREYERLKFRFHACSKASGNIIEQGLTILDLKGVSMSIVSGRVKYIYLIQCFIGKRFYKIDFKHWTKLLS